MNCFTASLLFTASLPDAFLKCLCCKLLVVGDPRGWIRQHILSSTRLHCSGSVRPFHEKRQVRANARQHQKNLYRFLYHRRLQASQNTTHVPLFHVTTYYSVLYIQMYCQLLLLILLVMVYVHCYITWHYMTKSVGSFKRARHCEEGFGASALVWMCPADGPAVGQPQVLHSHWVVYIQQCVPGSRVRRPNKLKIPMLTQYWYSNTFTLLCFIKFTMIHSLQLCFRSPLVRVSIHLKIPVA